MNGKHITSRQNPIVARYRSVAAGEDRSYVLLDGVHLVADALAARVDIAEAALTPDAWEQPEVAALASRLGTAGIDVLTVAAPVMSALSAMRSPSPIVALGARPRQTEADLCAVPQPVIVCAVDVQDPGNVGAIVRVAEAGGATGFAAAGHSADPFGWKALRGSMGSALRLPTAGRAETGRLIECARKAGCRIVASVPRGGRPPDTARLQGPLVLLVGGEGAGLPPAIVEDADERVSIPMAAPVESLNAAICAALLVYEARRQRLGTPHGHPVS